MEPVDLIQQGKIKRFFRSRRKLTAPRLVSHLTQRAAGKEPLFIEESDYLTMLALLKEIAEKRSLSVFAFCLMHNHVHILLRPAADDLASGMRDLFSRYAIYFNRKYKRKGHLFGGPYRQAVCLDKGYLIAASLYIHNNPVKAGLCDTPLKYRWSSTRLYCGETSHTAFVYHTFILDLLGGVDAGKEKYRVMLDRCSGIDVDLVLERPGALDGFRKKISALFPHIFGPLHWTRQAPDEAQLIDQETIEARIRAIKEGKAGDRLETRAAKQFLVKQLVSRGYTKTEIAEMIGVSRKTVYNLLASCAKACPL